jgi:hypothetical protein
VSTEERIDYARFMKATWTLLNSGPAGRARLLDGLPPKERGVLASVGGPLLELEQARRRKTVSDVLLESFPVTYFAYVAREGASGVMRFLESHAWETRPTQPGSCFPPAATSSAAFIRFLDSIDWMRAQESWVKEAFAFENAYLFGAPRPAARNVARNVDGRVVRLAPSAWVAEASFDVLRYGQVLRERGQKEPWHDALFFVKPYPCPSAVISTPLQAKVRRVRLTGPTAVALRWIWDESEAVPPHALEDAAFRRAHSASLVEVT